MHESHQKPLTARRCYGHLGGKLGNLVFERMIELGWFAPSEGKSTVYDLTAKGREELTRLGVDLTSLEKK